MRLLAVALLMLGMLATACSGGEAKVDGGDADYLDRFVAWSERDPDQRDETPTREEGLERLRESLAGLKAMDPPDGLEDDHEGAVDALERLIEIVVALPADETLSPLSDEAREASRLRDDLYAYDQAVDDYYGVAVMTVEGASMVPALCKGAVVVATAVDHGTEIERWDIIVFEFPGDTERDFIKRVVGLPGETISVVDGGQVLIDGQPVEGDSYALMSANYKVEPLVIPADSYYVLGDNRRNSYDSHAWGAGASSNLTPAEASTVPRDHILGVLPADTVDCPKAGAPEGGN